VRILFGYSVYFQYYRCTYLKFLLSTNEVKSFEPETIQTFPINDMALKIGN
jgi:hypothetical protein